MADIIFIPISGVLPKEGSTVTYIGNPSGYAKITPTNNNLWSASGYDARFDTRLTEGMKVKVIP